MTVVRQLLTNLAYGFPRGKTRRVKPVALAMIHITGNSRTALMPDLHAAARAERNYANRTGSNGPSAHYYIARDGWAIEAIDPALYAAWSNGDVSRPSTTNPGIVRALAFRARGYNVNEAYLLEFEAVGFGSNFPITAPQKQAMAEIIAAIAKMSGLPINRETVHGHWEINGVDRQNCPIAPAGHEAFLGDVIARARALLPSPVPSTVPSPVPPKEEVVKAFYVPELRTLAAVKAGSWLYADSAMGPSTANVQLNPARELVYVGQLVPAVRIVAYERAIGDANATTTAMFVAATDISGYRLAPAPVRDCTSAVNTAVAAAVAPVKKQLDIANGRIRNSIISLGGTVT